MIILFVFKIKNIPKNHKNEISNPIKTLTSSFIDLNLNTSVKFVREIIKTIM